MISAASSPLSFLLLVDSRSPFRDPPSCPNYRFRKLVLFLSHCPRQDYREVPERKSLEKQPRACCSFYLSLFSFCSCCPFNLLHRLSAGYQSSKSNNIISLRLPARGPIPFPRAWRNPAVEFMADSVVVTPAVGLHKGVQGTYSHTSTRV